MSPHHVKRLLGALAENVQRFEKQHGPIQDHGQEDLWHAIALHGAAGSGLSHPVLGAVDDATDRACQPFGQRRCVGRFGRHFGLVRCFRCVPRQVRPFPTAMVAWPSPRTFLGPDDHARTAAARAFLGRFLAQGHGQSVRTPTTSRPCRWGSRQIPRRGAPNLQAVVADHHVNGAVQHAVPQGCPVGRRAERSSDLQRALESLKSSSM